MTATIDPEARSGAPDRERDRVAVVVGLSAAAVWVGLYALYVRVWIQPNDARGNLEAWARPVAEGTAAAPFQYRFLVPDLLVWWADHLGWRVGFGAQVVDAVALAAGAATLSWLLVRLDLRAWVLPAALFGAYSGLGLLWWGKFETLASFAALAVATAALLGVTRRRTAAYAVAAVVLAGTRTDLLVALGVAEFVRWWWCERRAGRPGLPVAGAALAAAGVGATMALKALWPDAAYDPGTGVVQLTHNVQPTVALTAVAFLAPALAPFALCWRGPRMAALVRPHLQVVVPLAALVAFEVASVVVIGRIDEVRLLFPLVTPLAVLGAIGWGAVIRLDATTPPT